MLMFSIITGRFVSSSLSNAFSYTWELGDRVHKHLGLWFLYYVTIPSLENETFISGNTLYLDFTLSNISKSYWISVLSVCMVIFYCSVIFKLLLPKCKVYLLWPHSSSCFLSHSSSCFLSVLMLCLLVQDFNLIIDILKFKS